MILAIYGSDSMIIDTDLIQELIRFFRLDHVENVVVGDNGNVAEAGHYWSNLFLDKEPLVLEPEWKKYQELAIEKRDEELMDVSDAMLLIHNDPSSDQYGDIRSAMDKKGKKVYEIILR